MISVPTRDTTTPRGTSSLRSVSSSKLHHHPLLWKPVHLLTSKRSHFIVTVSHRVPTLLTAARIPSLSTPTDAAATEAKCKIERLINRIPLGCYGIRAPLVLLCHSLSSLNHLALAVAKQHDRR